MTVIPRFEYELIPSDVDPARPLIYLWEIVDRNGEAVYRYVGKAERGAGRPMQEYRRNVNNLLARRPYRAGNPDGFRRVHRRMAAAIKAGERITLRFLANPTPEGDLLALERHWQSVFGADPADGASPGDSAVQRLAEPLVLAAIERARNVKLTSGRRELRPGVVVEIDGVSEDPPVLVEVWVHQGAPKAAQKHKVLGDALKLVWADRVLFNGTATKIIAMTSNDAALHFGGKSWAAAALQDLGVEVVVVTLPPDVLARIRIAQRVQER